MAVYDMRGTFFGALYEGTRLFRDYFGALLAQHAQGKRVQGFRRCKSQYSFCARDGVTQCNLPLNCPASGGDFASGRKFSDAPSTSSTSLLASAGRLL